MQHRNVFFWYGIRMWIYSRGACGKNGCLKKCYSKRRKRFREPRLQALRDAADEIETGDVILISDAEEQRVAVPERPRFEVELERLTDSETGEQRYEVEYEIRWTN